MLLSLFRAELRGFFADFEAAIARCAEGDVPALAEAGAQAFITHPRFSTLVSIMSSVLEQNVSEAKIIELKRDMANFNMRVAAAIQSKLPGASLDDCAWAVATAATLVAGMWPAIDCSTAADKVLSMPEFAHLKPLPERDLPRAIGALLRSIAR